MSTQLPGITKKHCACTKINVSRSIYDWTISNYNCLTPESDPICSPHFSAGNDDQLWRLTLHMYNPLNNGNTLVFLKLVNPKEIGSFVHCQLSIFRGKDLIATQSSEQNFNKEKHWGHVMSTDRAALLESSISNQVSNAMTIRCEIEIPIANDIVSCPEKLEPIEPQPEECRPNGDFRLFLGRSDFSDVTFIVGDDKIPAHMLILTARSSVFANMFQGKTVENPRIVKFEGLQAEVVRGMLEFLYTNQVSDLERLASGLLEAAQTYDLKPLRYRCVKILSKNLNKNNAVDFLVVADLHAVEDLKETILKYIKAHFLEVVETEGYGKLKDPDLLKEIFRFVYESKERRCKFCS